MSQSLALTCEALKAQAHYFRSFEHLLELELSGLSGDSRYELNFSRLVKPDPFRLFDVDANADQPFMLGTDQRDYLVPLLAARLDALTPGARVLDLGSGDGQTTAAALHGRAKPLTLLPLDPADGALARYQDHFASELPHISVPETLVASIDDLLAGGVGGAGTAAALKEPLQMIVAIHSLYFSADLAGLLRFAHDRLPPRGKVVIVFAECNGRFSGRLAEDYWREHPGSSGGDHAIGGDDLDRFFGVLDAAAGRAECEAALRDRLGDDLFGVVDVTRQPSRLFGHDLGDIIAAGFLTSLSAADDDQLKHQIHYVSQRLQAEPETFDLRLSLDGPRARMLSVAQPQIFIELEKR